MGARGLVLLVCSLLAGAAVYTGCGSDDTAVFDGGPDGTTDVGPDGPGFGGDAGCKTAADCDGGVCTSGGQCCDSPTNVCGGACCAGGSVCLFDQCVVPGKDCFSSNDCGPNEYCEPALGGDAGASDAGLEAGCSEPLPRSGKCLPLPPTCQGDAGTTADGGTCIAQCEYHPPPGGPLSAKTKWTWGPNALTFTNKIDIWATPTVGRLYDTNCDGKIDSLDSPVIVFVSGNTGTVNCNNSSAPNYPNACHNGVLRMVDGRTGNEIWSLDKATSTSVGFMVGISVATGDVDGDGYMDIVAMTAEGYIVVVDRNGNVKYTSDHPYGTLSTNTGWGGGLAVADIDLDGWPEIAYADTVWTMKGGALTRLFVGGKGTGGAVDSALSAFSDMDLKNDGHLELLAGNTCYTSTGGTLWQNTNVTNGFPGVGDFDKDGKPEAVVVGGGKVWILAGATGAILAGPFTLPGTGGGGPPTVADFDGDGYPEIGVAQANYYSVLKPTVTNNVVSGMTLLWKMGNHDFSSSETGSTVFDFEGDGVAEVVYADECWLWVFDGPTGAVRLAVPHSSFTATEASLVADIDGDGHAEMLIPSQGVSMTTWTCAEHEKNGSGGPVNGQYWTPGPQSNSSYRGLVAIGDTADSWVGTRTLWNEHTYHVSNVCDDSDNACGGSNVYGSIPKGETPNWTLPWLNDFRQNVQDKGIFNAPDAVVSLVADCTMPVVAHVSIRNIGQSGLPAGVIANVYVTPGDIQVGQVTTTIPLLPGQTQTLDVTLSSPADKSSSLYAKIYVDPQNPTFHQCNDQNDQSATVQPACVN
jgi:hypothetical protein